jgi:hypothetical protein
MGLQLTATRTLTPFFRAMWIKDSFWRGIQAKYGPQPLERAMTPPPELLEAAADPDEIFTSRAPQVEDADR